MCRFALDSADVWADPELFQIDEECSLQRLVQAVRRMHFFTDQLWEILTWLEKHKAADYHAWWIQRMTYCMERYDVAESITSERIWRILFHTLRRCYCRKRPAGKGTGTGIIWGVKRMYTLPGDRRRSGIFITGNIGEACKDTRFPGIEKCYSLHLTKLEDSEYLPHLNMK